MSTPKLPTALTELAASPAVGDLLEIVDVSDTTDNAAGTSKKITLANLLGDYAAASHNHAASEITSGTMADALVAESNVTQHEAALTITESQISDLGSYAALAGATFTGAVTVSAAQLLVNTSTASGGVSAHSDADDLVIESDSNVGMTIKIGNSATLGTLRFATGNGSSHGRVEYNRSTDALALYANNSLSLQLDSSGNIGFNVTSQFGGGAKVLGICNATTVPTTNPTGGGVVYCEGGALKYRGSSGTITTIATA